jgi:hypothetical protein
MQPSSPNIPNNPNQAPQPMPENQSASKPEAAPAPAPAEKAPAGPTNAGPVADPSQLISAVPDPAPVKPDNPGQALPTQQIVPGVGTNPQAANDIDVIEKEWVDQANKVVEQTQQNPYQEEEAVESLQIDYLKKRYGHDVKKPEAK